MGHHRRDDRRSTWSLALHALLQSRIILRLGCSGPRDHSAAPSHKRSAITSSWRTDAIDSGSLIINRQDCDRHDLCYYVDHSFRLAWCVVASLHLISRAWEWRSLAFSNLSRGCAEFASVCSCEAVNSRAAFPFRKQPL